MPFQIIRDDITRVEADAIVNTANPLPKYASGTDAAIYQAAGAEQLLAERKKIGVIPVGSAAVTPAFDLKAKYIIHTVAPTWQGGDKGEFDDLKNCYRTVLEKAFELGCESVAFPLLAAGNYMFPKAEALRIALDEISAFLMREEVEMTVKLVVFDEKAFRLSRNLFFQVESYISDEEVLAVYTKEYGTDERSAASERGRVRDRMRASGYYNDASAGRAESVPVSPVGAQGESSEPHPKYSVSSFDENTFDKNLYLHDDKEDCAFRDCLMGFLVKKGVNNNVVYKRSNVSKGAFSKILCGDTKKPQKTTVLGFCIGLRLTVEESIDLLASADMAFNPYNKRDSLVIRCIERGQYDINEVNAMLFVCEQPLLGN